MEQSDDDIQAVLCPDQGLLRRQDFGTKVKENMLNILQCNLGFWSQESTDNKRFPQPGPTRPTVSTV